MVRRQLAGRKQASAQMLDIRTHSFTLPQAEILQTMLKVAKKSRLPIYKEGKVTDHFKTVYLSIVLSFHVSICRFVSPSSGLSVFHCEAGSLTHGGRIGLKMKTLSASRMVGRMERFYFLLMRVLRDCFLLLSPELSLLISALYIYKTHFSAFLWATIIYHRVPLSILLCQWFSKTEMCSWRQLPAQNLSVPVHFSCDKDQFLTPSPKSCIVSLSVELVNV